MKKIATRILSLLLVAAVLWPCLQVLPVKKASFFVTHTWSHLHSDHMSLPELSDHYSHDWEDKDHAPLSDQESSPFSTGSNLLVVFLGAHEVANAYIPEVQPERKAKPYSFSVITGDAFSIFHPPRV